MRGRRVWSTQWTDDLGQRHTATFGYADEVSEGQAMRLFQHWRAQWLASTAMQTPVSLVTVAVAIERYVAYARTKYVRDGKPTGEATNVFYALQPFSDLFGELTPDELRGAHVAAFQRHLIEKNNARSMVNKRVGILRRWARWVIGNDLAKPDLHTYLWTAEPVRMGQFAAREADPVGPVDEQIVRLTLEHCPATIKAMIQLQLLTGMRPGEVCAMRAGDVVTSKTPWLYRPSHHKTAHHGRTRTIAIGPQAREIIQPFLSRDLLSHLFTPAEAVQQRRGKPSRGSAGHDFRPCYTTHSYRRAIKYACEAAKVAEWSPNRLRHAALTRIAEQMSANEAKVIAGHSDVRTTATYLRLLTRDDRVAAKVMERVG
jgi:integrase